MCDTDLIPQNLKFKTQHTHTSKQTIWQTDKPKQGITARQTDELTEIQANEEREKKREGEKHWFCCAALLSMLTLPESYGKLGTWSRSYIAIEWKSIVGEVGWGV